MEPSTSNCGNANTDPVRTAQHLSGEALARHLVEIGRSAGLEAIGITHAEVLQLSRTVLHHRKAKGLAGTMNFTYRNPDRSTDPGRALSGARSIIAGAYGYGGLGALAPSLLSGRVARYSWRDYYGDLHRGLDSIATELRELGYSARVYCDDNSVVDRNVAYRAGLGWYGKNANLLLPGTGSWFVLGSVITNAELPPNTQPLADQCGSCRQCFDACPTDAIVGPGVVDARRCLAWLVQAGGEIPPEFREAVGDRLYGCDDCQDVCPPNKKYGLGVGAAMNDSTIDPWVPLIWLLSVSDTQLLERVGRWYIAKRDPAVVRRTALVILGNTADPDDKSVVDTLGRYLIHQNPLLRAHAVWASRRLGLEFLLESVRDDADPSVQRELIMPVRCRFGSE